MVLAITYTDSTWGWLRPFKIVTIRADPTQRDPELTSKTRLCLRSKLQKTASTLRQLSRPLLSEKRLGYPLPRTALWWTFKEYDVMWVQFCLDRIRQFLIASAPKLRPALGHSPLFQAVNVPVQAQDGVLIVNNDGISFVIMDEKAKKSILLGGKRNQGRLFASHRFIHLPIDYLANFRPGKPLHCLLYPVCGVMDPADDIIEKPDSVLGNANKTEVSLPRALEFF